jgi:hypothetical protein
VIALREMVEKVQAYNAERAAGAGRADDDSPYASIHEDSECWSPMPDRSRNLLTQQGRCSDSGGSHGAIDEEEEEALRLWEEERAATARKDQKELIEQFFQAQQGGYVRLTSPSAETREGLEEQRRERDEREAEDARRVILLQNDLVETYLAAKEDGFVCDPSPESSPKNIWSLSVKGSFKGSFRRNVSEKFGRSPAVDAKSLATRADRSPTRTSGASIVQRTKRFASSFKNIMSSA